MSYPRILLSVCLSSILLACAGSKRVSEKTPPGELGPSVGYVAFRYERTERHLAEMKVRRMETGEDYVFRLDRPAASSIYLSFGPVKAYEKFFGDTAQQELLVIPLPAGEYACRSLQVMAFYPGWQAFLLRQEGAILSRSLEGRTFSVAADTVTYIGTYRTRVRTTLFGGVRYRVEHRDDGEERAAKAGLPFPFRKRLVALE